MASRELDIVIFGATGDTGVVGCCCLFFKGRTLGIQSWAPAARNLDKLKADVLDRFAAGPGPGEEGLAHSAPIQADIGDFDSLVSMCSKTRCVLACAGPYTQYGEAVVRACVEAGTNYVDITGEVAWVEKMMRRYGDEAEKKGVHVVCCAGYDSVPPDLATNLAVKGLEKEGEALSRFETFIHGDGGAMPTGTVNTFCNMIDARKMAVLRKVTFGAVGGSAGASDPQQETPQQAPGPRATYAPQSVQETLRSNLLWTMLPGYSALAGGFCLPHIMAPINLHTVHRTAAREGYGGITYRERGGSPPSSSSLYGLPQTAIGFFGMSLVTSFLYAVPYSTTAVKALRDRYNPALRNKVRDACFNGFSSTGKTSLVGLGASSSGRRTVKVELQSIYDGGLGFTMLFACVTAAEIVKKAKAGPLTQPGFNTAVCAVGGSPFADALRTAGMRLEVTVSEPRSAL